MIGKKIQQLRLKKGLTLSELATRAGVAKSYLSAIERDIQSNPSIQFLEKISKVLDVSADSLLLQEENMIAEEIDLDQEWYELVKEAMESGVSKDEFREYLMFNKWKIDQTKKQDN